MATNPMQRKARNSFLLGMLITLVITGLIIAFLIMQLMNAKQEQKKAEETKKTVYTITANVKSGQLLTEDMLKKQEVRSDLIPSNATDSQEIVSSWFLVTKDGDDIYTDSVYDITKQTEKQFNTSSTMTDMYINKADGIVEVYPNESNPNSFFIVNGINTQTNQFEKLTINNPGRLEEDDGYFVLASAIGATDNKTRIYQNAAGNYYIYTYNSNTETITKKYLEINNVPLIAKVDLKENTVITPSLVKKANEPIDVRKQEYNMIVLQSQIESGSYIDIRLRLPDGTDYIVLPYKRVEIAQTDGFDSLNTIWMELSETEILTMSCAIVQSYQISGSLLYANTYTDAGLQNAAKATYLPSDTVVNLIAQDPNCVTEARNALIKRYNDARAKGNSNERLPIDNALKRNDAQETLDKTISGTESEIERTQEERQRYLESLGGNY